MRAVALALVFGLASADDVLADDDLADDVLKDRRATIESMTPDAAAALRHRWNRFRALPAEDQDRLRQLHHDLEGEANSTRLHEVLVRYQQWLKQISPGQRAELMSLAPGPRIAQIKRLQVQQRRRAQRARRFRSEMERQVSNQPSPGDIDVIWSWLEEFTAANQEKILSTVPESRRAYLEGLDGPRRQVNLSRIAQGPPRGRSRGRGRQSTSLITAEHLRDLEARLSPAARERLDQQLGSRDASLRQWIRSAVFTRMRRHYSPGGRFTISQQELEQFFEYDLTSDERASLLDMPGDEMQRELRWLYMQGPSAQRTTPSRRGGRGGREMGGPRSRPDDPPRGPRRRGGPPPRERRGPPPGPPQGPRQGPR